MNSLQDKHVLVLGLGLHGGAIGTLEWLASQKAIISVSDIKTKEQLASSIEKLKTIPDIRYHFGNQDELDLSGVDMIIRNPGVPRTSPILQKARELHIPIEMDSSLFFEYSPSNHIIGITGSKGKTTTSSAIAYVLKVIHPKTVAVGIDGISPLGALAPLTPARRVGGLALSQNGRGNTAIPIIFELSSWRLEALQEKKMSPHIAVCTSIYKDHLNTYKSFEEYIDTKKQIIRNQKENDIAILNGNDEKIRTWEPDVQGKLYWYSLEKLEDNEEGIWIKGDEIFTRLRTSPNLSLVRRGDDAKLPSPYQGEGLGDEVNQSRICKTSDIPHTSPHELRNKLPAILLGLLHGGEISTIVQALQTIPALKHRLQLVKTIHDVAYINDSAATMPDATIAALQSFAQKPIILILGGSDKALEFQDLAQEIAAHKNIKHLIWLPGTATNRMKEEILPKTNATSHNAASMEEAVQTASQRATSGDTVLLSPGATSFGLFLHEFDRGDAFIKSVQEIV